jgi:hypothetical protein
MSFAMAAGLKAMQDPLQKKDRPHQISYWLICIALIVVGIVATAWGGPWDLIRPTVKEIGSGILTAGILASFVETYFRREFARDAFLAAFRHMLPPEFRDEI